MSDSTAGAVFVEGLVAAGSKSAVLKRIADLWGPRWTPTSTCCSRRCSVPPTISCPSGRTTRPGGHRRGGRHVVRGAGDHGDPVGPAVLGGRGQASVAPVPAAAPAAGV